MYTHVAVCACRHACVAVCACRYACVAVVTIYPPPPGPCAGKGSTATLLARILQAAGYKVGPGHAGIAVKGFRGIGATL